MATYRFFKRDNTSLLQSYWSHVNITECLAPFSLQIYIFIAVRNGKSYRDLCFTFYATKKIHIHFEPLIEK